MEFHGNAIAYNNHGFLLLGPHLAGKSQLSLILTQLYQCTLIADDCTIITHTENTIICSPIEGFGGKIESQPFGIITIDFVKNIPLCAVFRHQQPAESYQHEPNRITILDKEFPQYNIDFQHSFAPHIIARIIKELA